MIKQYAELLSPIQVKQIHELSLEILNKVGLRVKNNTAREILINNGCRPDEQTEVIYFPPKVVEHFIKSIPPSFTFHGRDPKFDRTIPNNRPVISTASAAPNILDPETDKVRRARSDDIARIAFLVNELAGYDTFSISVTADDAPPEQFSLSRVYPALKHCLKPILCSPPNLEELENLYLLGSLVAGSEEAFWDRPFMTFVYTSVVSPLTLDSIAADKLINYSRSGIPCFGAVVPTAGVSAPFSMAGVLAMTNAEVLAQITLEQMVMPGKPTLYCVLPSVADIRNAAYVPGAIETGILTMGSAQMARYYQIPSGGFIGQTNSKNNDAQSGFEPGMSTMASLLSGLDFYFLGGLLDAMMTFDYAKAVIDSEIALMLRQTNRGIEFDTNDLEQDFDVIMETGPGGIFTDKIHTRDRMRITALFPNIADRTNLQQWENNGKPDVRVKAMQVVYKLFSHNNPAVFSPDLDSQIRSRFTDLVLGDFQPLIPY